MNILVVDPDPLSGKVLAFLLHGEGFAVETVDSIRAAQAFLRHDTPWLILLEATLPDGDGFTYCRTLSETEPDVPVILLTGRASMADRIAGLRLGADDYVSKPYDPTELVERVKAVLRRSSHLAPHLVHDTIQVGDLVLSAGALTVSIAGRRTVALTPTEMRILSCLLSHAGKVLSRSQIAEIALGYDYGGSSNVIDVYIRRLRRKIEVDPMHPTYIETVIGSGYRIRHPERSVQERSTVRIDHTLLAQGA